MPCDLGVGCDESGVCYAATHGHPEECGAKCTHEYEETSANSDFDKETYECRLCGDRYYLYYEYMK